MIKNIFLYLLLFFIAACGGGSGGSSDDNGVCSVVNQNKYLYDLMHDRYLWLDEVPTLDYTAYSSPESLLNHMVYQPVDRWSYIADKTVVDNYYNGANVGLGVGFRLTDSELIIRYVYPGSPADLAGISRGDRILRMNGVMLSEIVNDSSLLDVAVGPSVEGWIVEMTVQQTDNTVHDVTVVKDDYYANPVLHSSIINDFVSSEIIGYVVLKSFNNATMNELNTVFETFQAAGVTAIIFDMRDNGGGYLSVVGYLGYLLKQSLSHYLATTLVFNDLHQNDNYDIFFGQSIGSEDSFDLDKIIFLTSGNTASASEMLITALAPYMDVKLIGDDTYGKPVGMRSHEYCGKYFTPIEFRSVNSVGITDYFDGLSADCYVLDSIHHSFGNIEEPFLGAALDMIRTDNCSGSLTSNVSQRFANEDKIQYHGIRQVFESY